MARLASVRGSCSRWWACGAYPAGGGCRQNRAAVCAQLAVRTCCARHHILVHEYFRRRWRYLAEGQEGASAEMECDDEGGWQTIECEFFGDGPRLRAGQSAGRRGTQQALAGEGSYSRRDVLGPLAIVT